MMILHDKGQIINRMICKLFFGSVVEFEFLLYNMQDISAIDIECIIYQISINCIPRDSNIIHVVYNMYSM